MSVPTRRGEEFALALVAPVKRWASRPQAQIVPSDLMAKAIQSPMPTSTQFVSGETRVGTGTLEPLWDRV